MTRRSYPLFASSLALGLLAACTQAPGGVHPTSGGLPAGTGSAGLINNNSGSLAMTLSDGSAYSTQAAPSSPTIKHVFVNFSKVQIHYDGAASASAPASASADTDPGWLDFNASASQTIDLVNMPQDSMFGAMTQLQNGTYTQIRLAVNTAEVDYTDTTGASATASLDVSSGNLKIIKPFTLSANQQTILHFDFDSKHSVRQDGPGGTWRMNPTAVHTVVSYQPFPSASASASP